MPSPYKRTLVYHTIFVFIAGILFLFILIREKRVSIEPIINTMCSIINSGPVVLENVSLIDQESNEERLSNILQSGKIVLYFPEMSCIPCAQRGIELINSRFKEHNRLNVIVISHFANRRHQAIVQEQFQLQTYSLSDEIFNDKDLSQDIVAFYCDSTLIVPNYYCDGMETPSVNGWSLYLDVLRKKLK